jgi:hypothetical protein
MTMVAKLYLKGDQANVPEEIALTQLTHGGG